MDGFVKTTNLGYDFWEVASAFQKSVRRGMEKEALYWAIELFDSGYETYCWKRMIVMASEDIGLGEPSCIVQVMACKQSFDFLTNCKDMGGRKLPFTQAVVCLVRSRKSRYIDHAITVNWQAHKEELLPIPDFAYDMHTRKGKSLGRGLKYFYEESCKIVNANKLVGEEELEREAWMVDNVYGVEREDVPFSDAAFKKSEKEADYAPTLF